jgi:predicted flap endonuclease-1-like 5' DNA nuclease
MLTILDQQLIAVLVALAIGVVVGFWIFRRVRAADTTDRSDTHIAAEPRPAPVPPPAPAPPPARRDTPEGNTIFDEGAAAAGDVAGQLLGVEVHSQLPGAEGPPDDLQMMKGVGPKLAQKLNENGITRFEQLARLSRNEVEMLDERMGAFRGRLERDRIVEQASYLARDDRDGFEARFGKLGSA